MLQSLYESLLQGFEFLGHEREYTSKYNRRLETGYIRLAELEKELSEQNLLPGTDDIPVFSNGNYSQLFQEGAIIEDYKSYICHLTLKASSQRLPEYSGKFCFPPYINFLLKECKN